LTAIKEHYRTKIRDDKFINNNSPSRRKGKGQNTICFTQDGIIKYLYSHPELINDKKFHELIVGWIITQFLEESLKKNALIWFPPKLGWEKQAGNEELSIAWLLKNHNKIFDDSEVDIYIGTDQPGKSRTF